MELGWELSHEERMLGMGSAPDRAEQSASLGEEGEPSSSRKQGHQPVLRGSGGGGAEVWGSSRTLGPRSTGPPGFGWGRRQKGMKSHWSGSICIVNPQGTLASKETEAQAEVKSFTQERLTTHYQAIIIKSGPGAELGRPS